MRINVDRRPLRRILRWSHRTLLAAAVATLGYCGFVVTDAWVFQQAERRQLEDLLRDRPDLAMEASAAVNRGGRRTASPGSLRTLPPVLDGGLIGRIEIPSLGLSAIVMEGTSTTTLRRAVGHISGTAFPGLPGNIGISGHRDTFFRPLRNIRQNDMITVTTPLGEYRYRVVSTKIVGPADLAVLNPSGSEILTLVTCYPFYFVGSAPNRFVVRAERVT